MTMISEKIRDLINKAIQELDLPEADFIVEHPSRLDFGDYFTNAGIVLVPANPDAPKLILDYLNKNLPEDIEKVENKAGFINFFLSQKFLIDSIKNIVDEGENFGKTNRLSGQKTIVEYTDPNPFKKFHIGHLMSNTIGESISRLIEWNGSEIKRACYQGDVGVHVAKAIWGKVQNSNLSWGEAYAFGAQNYERNKDEIDALNKKIYERTDPVITRLYDEGRDESLQEFEKMYERLGTKFDFNFFESETGKRGLEIVKQNIGSVFEESDGAIIYRGEDRDKTLHTRVFVNKDGLPTYEAKELGLAPLKYEKYKYDTSVVITGNEVNDYFRVLLNALGEIYPEFAKKTRHVSHGILRLTTGKMSSRTGDVVTAESLIDVVKNETKGDETVAIAAIKYSILKQSTGKNIIFDMEKSVSIDGDSGPYIQYSAVRANSVLNKAKEEEVEGSVNKPEKAGDLERMLYRLPGVISNAGKELAPHHVTGFVTEVASLFNSFYHTNPIVVKEAKESEYRVFLTEATKIVIENSLNVLGMKIPEKM